MSMAASNENVILTLNEVKGKDLAFAPMPGDSRLAAELWTSMASLLRSHAAMHSIAAPGHPLRIRSSSNTQIELLGPSGKLSIVGPSASGIGATEFRPETGELGDEYAAFSFTQDGLISFENQETALDMEAAVEYLLHKVQA